MPKVQTIDPKKVRRPGFVEFRPIPVNQYQKSVSDERGNFTNDEFHAIYHDMVLIREFETMLNLIKTKGEYNGTDRKSTRLNSSHVRISYAVFCLKKKKKKKNMTYK